MSMALVRLSPGFLFDLHRLVGETPAINSLSLILAN